MFDHLVLLTSFTVSILLLFWAKEQATHNSLNCTEKQAQIDSLNVLLLLEISNYFTACFK